MPDISMCQNSTCPSKLKCYRYMAMPNEYRQAYAEFVPEGEQCADLLFIYKEHTHMMNKYYEERIKEGRI